MKVFRLRRERVKKGMKSVWTVFIFRLLSPLKLFARENLISLTIIRTSEFTITNKKCF